MTDSALSGRSRLLHAVLGSAVLAGTAGAGLYAAVPSDGGTVQYAATFGRAGQGLDDRSDVKVRGVTVGTVASVTLTPAGKVRVRMRVRDDVRVPRDTRARVEPVSVFGPKKVSLDLGSGPYLEPGGTIARTVDPSDPSQTARPLHELTGAISAQDVNTLLHTFSRGLEGQAPALRRTIANGGAVIDAAHANRAVIRSLIADINGLGGTLGPRGGAITGASGDLGDLSASLADRPDKITQLLDRAGRLSATVGGTLGGHGPEIGRIIDGSGDAAAVIAGEDQKLIMLADALNGFFDGLASVMTADGPSGTRPAVLRGSLPLDVCQIVVDACGPVTKP